MLKRIDNIIGKYIDNGSIPGAVVLLARKGKVVYNKAFGKADESRSLQTDALFRLASMTKPFVGAAVMQLFDRGEILLNDPISLYVPEFRDLNAAESDGKGKITLVPARREITIHDLLSLTSGIIDKFVYAYPDPARQQQCDFVIEEMHTAGVRQGLNDPDMTIEDHVKSLTGVPLAFHPGQQFNYGDNGLFLLALMIERVTGQPLDRYLKQNLFAPLGMKETSFYPAEKDQPKLTALYYAHDTENGKKGELFTKPEYMHPAGYFSVDPSYSFGKNKKYFEPGAGLHGTTEDYCKFAQMLADGGVYKNERLLSTEAVHLMSTNRIGSLRNPITQNRWGYTLDIQEDDAPMVPGGMYLGGAGTYGWEGVFGTKFWINPKYEYVLLFMTHVWWSFDVHYIQQRVVQTVNAAVE